LGKKATGGGETKDSSAPRLRKGGNHFGKEGNRKQDASIKNEKSKGRGFEKNTGKSPKCAPRLWRKEKVRLRSADVEGTEMKSGSRSWSRKKKGLKEKTAIQDDEVVTIPFRKERDESGSPLPPITKLNAKEGGQSDSWVEG